jgi:hypothetical protein
LDGIESTKSIGARRERERESGETRSKIKSSLVNEYGVVRFVKAKEEKGWEKLA